MIKDPCDIYVFRVTQKNEPSIILAAVDENQYELWHAAFKRAKLMHLNSPTNADEKPYVSLQGAIEDQADGDEDTVGYERPESVVSYYYYLRMFAKESLSSLSYELPLTEGSFFLAKHLQEGALWN